MTKFTIIFRAEDTGDYYTHKTDKIAYGANLISYISPTGTRFHVPYANIIMIKEEQ